MVTQGSRFALHLGVFALAFIINPAYVAGCMSTGQEEPDFGEAEMREVLASANQTHAWSFDSDGTTYELTLVLEQAAGEDEMSAAPRPQASALSQVAHACGNRTFRQSASACVTVTEMPVTGTLTLREGETVVTEVNVTGALYATGRSLTSAELFLSFDDSTLNLRSDDAEHFELVDFRALALGEDGRTIDYVAD